MSSDWINKAKEAARQAAEEAKKLAESAKSANYGEMFDKTKNMAKQAAEEAKKAAGNIMNKEKENPTENPTPPAQPPVPPEQPNVVPGQPDAVPSEKPDTSPKIEPTQPISADPSVILERAAEAVSTPPASNPLVMAKLEQVEHLLREIKQLLQLK